jgi:predicted acylesterase/phospholipase RssA
MSKAHSNKPQCNLVMRGGVTSGLVYPPAIAKIAELYDFRCVGGTSAGAIAAAGAAAAALGAKKGHDLFQTRLKRLPEELSEVRYGKTVLERLFQPQPETRRLFRLLLLVLPFMQEEGRPQIALILGGAIALCVVYWQEALMAAAIIFIPLFLLAITSATSGASLWLLIILIFFTALVFAVASASGRAAIDLTRHLPKNNYGICMGSSNNTTDSAGVLPLTDWLNELFQDLACKAPESPVTFGDLWDNGKRENAERAIDLVLMTANITQGVSHRFPFIEPNRGQLFFNEKEFEELFPKSVVNWMVNHAQKTRNEEYVAVPNGFYGLPKPADLPILLGARMSLSFPFLISAVPLYTPNSRRRETTDVSDPNFYKAPLERCWFSDGGLISNFPMHLFDTPLALRPSFGINLVPPSVEMGEHKLDSEVIELDDEPVEKDADDEWRAIYMPSRNSSPLPAARFNRFSSVGKFFGALFDTARNWADTELIDLPGYRDRIVNIVLNKTEGGLNLSMGPEVMKQIGQRGRNAGELLVERFKPNPGPDPQTGNPIVLTWDNHRWVRFRAFMAAFEHAVRRLTSTWTDVEGQKPYKSYEELLKQKPSNYPLTAAQQGFVSDTMSTLVQLVVSWPEDHTFDRRDPKNTHGRSPRPKPVLRAVPTGSNDPLT